MKKESITLNVSFSDLCDCQDFLDGQGEETYDCIKKFTAVFTDNVEADIKICDGGKGGSPFVDAVLFHKGHEIGCLDAGDTLAGTYLFHKCRNINYEVIIPNCINAAKYEQDKYRDKQSIIKEWLDKQDNDTLNMIDATTLLEIQGSSPVIDRSAIIEEIMQRIDYYEEILDSLYERATIKFEAKGEQAFTSDNEI